VIELGRDDAGAYYVRGSIRAEWGDVSEARADLRRAIELAPTAEFADVVRALMSDYGLE
jgi:Flp pilus assembly protein TadD